MARKELAPVAGDSRLERRVAAPVAESAALAAAIDGAVDACRTALLRRQDPDGAWRYPLEGSSVLPDAHFLIAQRLFHLVPSEIERRLVARVRGRQLSNGGWPLHPGHNGHPSTTVEAYVALRMHGLPPEADALRRARSFLGAHGGVSRLSTLTRITLAVLGLRPWDDVPLLPVEIMLLPRRSPFNLQSFVSFTRIHMVSLLALGETRYRVPGVSRALAAELDGASMGPRAGASPSSAWEVAREALAQLWRYADWARRLLGPAVVRKRSLEACREYLITHQEPDGSWGNYILSTFFGILALRALGCSPDSVAVRHGYDGLRTLLWRRGEEILVQPCNSAIWSTALISVSLRETGLTSAHPALKRAARWLLRAQSLREGDWRCGCPNGPAYTWGFQEGNTLFPDVDDTVAAVRAVAPVLGPDDPDAARRCRRAQAWAVAMQNADGGWSAFDRNCRSWWLERIPFNDMHRAMTDPSTPDMTGRMLEYLGVRGWRVGRPEVGAAVAWLRRNQRSDGAWFGRWGIAYLYGTWAALTGLAAVGVPPEDPMIRRAVRWLETCQNPDGGWGESCRADTAGRYVPLGRSTPSQTGWALLALVSSAHAPTPAITRGLEYLLGTQTEDGTWLEDYTTGAGFAGKLYLDYRFYKDVWPLQALGLASRLLTRGRAVEVCPPSSRTSAALEAGDSGEGVTLDRQRFRGRAGRSAWQRRLR
jgi:sporulenol synthase